VTFHLPHAQETEAARTDPVDLQHERSHLLAIEKAAYDAYASLVRLAETLDATPDVRQRIDQILLNWHPEPDPDWRLPHDQAAAALDRADAARVRLADAIAASDEASERAAGHAMEAIVALIPQYGPQLRYACRMGDHKRCPGGWCPCPHHTDTGQGD